MITNRNAKGIERKLSGQFFTPAWAAEILYDAHLSHLTNKDLVWEPTCGTGNMLAAVPAHVPAIGTELDPQLAEYARKATGRTVITGNCLLDIPDGITAVFGNPPFIYDFFEMLMHRCSSIMQDGQKAVMLLPAYFFQTSQTVRALYRQRWTVSQQMVPRDIFPGAMKPLTVATFIRENNPKLIGFLLYEETADMRQLSNEMQDEIANRIQGPRSVWREVVHKALSVLGGTASLVEVYKHIEGRRPTENPFWKEQIRKVLQQSFNRVSEGIYSINIAA